ncbi:hypothetical protein [Enterococcus sp. AZ072]|uniref:hypothetical protein n=1 Tax=unclassified Enterococcus TaxID=2608891 RepID=UPI003D29C2E2
MIIKEKLYPYPVLAYFNDDINGKFEITTIDAAITIDKNKYVVQGETYLSNPKIEELIQSRSANIIVHIECRKTRYRQTFNIDSNKEFKCEIAATNLEGNVDIQLIIVATKRLAEYKNNDCHLDFEGLVFPIEAGQILAVCKPYSFQAQREPSKVKNLPSIFIVTRNLTDEDNPLEYELGNDQIIIKLSKENYLSYKTLMNNTYAQPIMSSMIIVPVLANILNSFSDEKDFNESSSEQWFMSIRKRMEECHLVFEEVDWEHEALSVANQLIGDPITLGLKKIQEGTD